MPAGTSFTYGELRAIDANIDNVTVVQMLLPTQQAEVHHAGQTAEWVSTDRETVMATMLSQAVPALMMEVGLTELHILTTNRTMNSIPYTTFQHVRGFADNIDQTPFVRMFQSRFESDVLQDVSLNNLFDYAFELNVNLLGETHIRVSVQQGPTIDYVTPSFCDALMVPVITGNMSNATQLASDFESLGTILTDRGIGTMFNAGATGFF
jgi:hypothetical protein